MLLIIVACIFAIISVVAFILYASDKYKARKGLWRIPEKVLLLISFFGGAVGGLSAMLICRHKTNKKYFYAVNIAGLIWQLGLLIFLIFLF